ncbi:unnamed protein product, partial [Closterium sp. Yama58-4]
MLGIFSVVYYSVVCLITSVLVVRYGFPVRLLRHLQVYVLTDQNAGVPMSSISNGQGKNRGRRKSNEPEADESSGKMMRILVQEGHLYSRKFFREFDETILFACIGIMAVFSREILSVLEIYLQRSGMFANQQGQQQQTADPNTPKQNLHSSSTGLFLMDHGGMIPLLLAAVAMWKIIRNWASVEWDRGTTRSSDFTQCALAGIASCLITGFLLFVLPASLTGFDFDSVAEKAGVTITNHFKSKGLAKDTIPEFIIPPTFIKTSLVLFSGVIGALCLPAAIRFVRCFYLSTSQQPWDTGIIHQGFWSSLLWNVSFLLPVLAAALWFRPLAEVFEPVVVFVRRAVIVALVLLAGLIPCLALALAHGEHGVLDSSASDIRQEVAAQEHTATSLVHESVLADSIASPRTQVNPISTFFNYTPAGLKPETSDAISSNRPFPELPLNFSKARPLPETRESGKSDNSPHERRSPGDARLSAAEALFDTSRRILKGCPSLDALADGAREEEELRASDFGGDFVFGFATSAAQVEGAVAEGGRGRSIWDDFAQRAGKIKDASNPAVTVDQYHRFKDDVALLKAMGATSYRFSISWSRIIPNGIGAVSEAGLQHYSRLIDELLANGIAPAVTLYHWDLPLHLHEAHGGWLNGAS